MTKVLSADFPKGSITSMEEAHKLRLMAENRSLYGNTIRKRRIALGLSQIHLANLIGVKPISVTQWEAGRTRPDIGNIVPLCKALGLTPGTFLQYRQDSRELTAEERSLLSTYQMLSERDRRVLIALANSLFESYAAELTKSCRTGFEPISHNYYTIAAGPSTPLGDAELGEKVYIRKSLLPRHADEIITVSGQSMEPEFFNGDTVFVEHTPVLEPGEIGVFVVNGVGYIKQFFPGRLHSVNPDYDDVCIDEGDNLKIVGRVLGKVPSDAYPNAREAIALKELETEAANKT